MSSVTDTYRKEVCAPAGSVAVIIAMIETSSVPGHYITGLISLAYMQNFWRPFPPLRLGFYQSLSPYSLSTFPVYSGDITNAFSLALNPIDLNFYSTFPVQDLFRRIN